MLVTGLALADPFGRDSCLCFASLPSVLGRGPAAEPAPRPPGGRRPRSRAAGPVCGVWGSMRPSGPNATRPWQGDRWVRLLPTLTQRPPCKAQARGGGRVSHAPLVGTSHAPLQRAHCQTGREQASWGHTIPSTATGSASINAQIARELATKKPDSEPEGRQGKAEG